MLQVGGARHLRLDAAAAAGLPRPSPGRGVARIGSDLLHHPLLAGCPWLLPTPQRFRAAANWLELVRQGVLDGAPISGLELEEAEWVNDLRQLLRELGLPLRSGGNSLQTPDDWIGRIRGTALALVVADGEVKSWASLRLGPLPSRPLSPVWLALPADWQEHPVLCHAAQELAQNGGKRPLSVRKEDPPKPSTAGKKA